MAEPEELRKVQALVDYRKKLMQHKELDARVRSRKTSEQNWDPHRIWRWLQGASLRFSLKSYSLCTRRGCSWVNDGWYMRQVCWNPSVDFNGAVRDNVKSAKKEFDKTEDDLKALQSVGQIIGEVLRRLDADRCKNMVIFNQKGIACVC